MVYDNNHECKNHIYYDGRKKTWFCAWCGDEVKVNTGG